MRNFTFYFLHIKLLLRLSTITPTKFAILITKPRLGTRISQFLEIIGNITHFNTIFFSPFRVTRFEKQRYASVQIFEQ
jgi:hypothetical protein